MGDFALRMFARAGAVLGLAAITAFGFTGTAPAAPADRATDPVVLKGSQVGDLIGSEPGKVVAFKWAGKWVQVPVQIDERHTISARSLYPDVPVGYVNNSVSFDVEVYADEKTRSGADADSTFDADDELVFMGGDAGESAPGSAVAPSGVDASSATKISVADPVGGGTGNVYLFTSEGKLDPSAGKDYVDYDFKLVNFGPEDTLIDDYGFTNTGNLEDSTVKTDSYELHSVDRWMEDELKITAGGAPGTDILDREAVSAGGLGGCSRSEYTFSANWGLDATSGNDDNTDDEGTYVTVIDGPVRAIRAYMGANSGPYVEDVHIYYADREDRAIYARVHPIPHMFIWTDYNDSAVGMSYRDQKNPAGVTIDGNPDSLVPSGMSDFENGKYLWQQVAGSHGTATTLVTAFSSATPTPNPPFNFAFAGYYLDDTTPSSSGGDRERQCGGDLKAYGASGFGIDGTYPNTDPILATPSVPEAKLSVNRIRYFGAPNQTAQDADGFRKRAQDPLAASASKASVKPRTASLKLKVLGAKPKAKAGKKARVKVRVTNTGLADGKNVKVCVTGKVVRRTCKTIQALPMGKSRIVTLTPGVKPKAKAGKSKLTVAGSAKGAKAGRTSVGVQVRRKG